MSRRSFLIGVALFGICALAYAESFSGKVIAVMDGDTLLVLRDGQKVKVRLAEIDAPEKDQPSGSESQKSLAGMVKGKQIHVESRVVDDYGRLVASIRLGYLDVNREQVRRGMAWEYSRYHSNKELVALQREAQQARRGLWAEDGPVEPSQWRKLHPDVAVVPPSGKTKQADHAGSCRKKHCSEMSTCEEAMHYFSVCGDKTLDGNADGIPCEKLCTARQEARTGQ